MKSTTTKKAPGTKRAVAPRSRVPALVGVSVAFIAIGGVFAASLLRPDVERTRDARPGEATLASTRPAATARTAVSLPGEPRTAAVAATRPVSLAASSAKATAAPALPTGPLAAILMKLVATQKTGDVDAVSALKADLKKLIDKDPEAAVAGLFSALRWATDEQGLAVLASLLSGEPKLSARADVLAALEDMAQGDDLPARRATAVRTLGNLAGGDESRVALLANMGRGDIDPAVREAAAVALGVLGDRAPGAVAGAAARSLVEGFASEPDPRVRSMLLYAVRDTREVAVADVLLQALAQDPDSSARQAAADMLGDVAAAHRSRALDALATQLGRETDPNFRATIVTSIVSAGRLTAIPVLERLRNDAGDLQATIDDYLTGLRSGEDNMDKLQAIKAAREQARGASPPADDDR